MVARVLVDAASIVVTLRQAVPQDAADASRIERCYRKYADQNPDLADLSLLALAERTGVCGRSRSRSGRSVSKPDRGSIAPPDHEIRALTARFS